MDKNRLPRRDWSKSVSLVYGHDKEIAAWVGNQLDIPDFGPCAAIGIALHGKIIGGCVYHDFTWPNIEVSLATINKAFSNRRVLRALFFYPFEQLNCRRITLKVAEGNHRALKFVEGLGFVREGYHPEARPEGAVISLGMLRRDCKWLGKDYGQEITERSRCA